jgi:hypothetical protein
MRPSTPDDARISSVAGAAPGVDDICDQLCRDRATVLAQLEALREETDAQAAFAQLGVVRRTWMIHVLAEETVVHKSLDGAAPDPEAGIRADERFAAHKRVEGLFDRLARARPGTLEWKARLDAAGAPIARHFGAQHQELCARLAREFDVARLHELGCRYELAREKLTLLEQAKAA